MFLVLIAVGSLTAFAIYVALWIPVAWSLVRLRVFRRAWQAACGMALLMSVPPVLSIWWDKLRVEECVAQNGMYDLSCGAELAGVMIFMFKLLMILFSIALGPFVFSALARRWFAKKQVSY